ncbi:MAG: hypothetical protein K0R36_3138 [Chryseobacterium sp.]|jgi:AraC-like DNA-binding protein|nr:hypothetical protein [Chryseobacterium sp.]
MKIWYLFLCYSLCSTVFAQNHKIFGDTLSTYDYSELESKFYNLKESNKITESKAIAEYYLKKAIHEKENNYIAEGYVLMHYNRSLSISIKYIDSLKFIKRNSQDDNYPTRIYLLKGRLYYDSDNEKLALNNFINALKYAKEKKNKRHIAIAEIYLAYLNNYIGKHTEAAKVLQYYYDNANFLDNNEREHIRLNLASTLLDINKLQPSLKLIHEGLNSTSKNGETDRYNQYLSLFGMYNFKSKNYQIAIDNLKKSKNYFSTQPHDLNFNYALLYLGLSYWGLKDKEKAIECFRKIDYNIQKTNNIFPELKEVYPYLIDYYKENNNKEKQLYYVNRFLTVYKELDSKFRYISRELPRRYDAPKLLQEKENIIREIENKKTISYVFIGFLLLSLSLLILAYYRSKKAEKQHKKIARDLLQSIADNHSENKVENSENIASKDNLKDRTNRVIAEDVAETILKELNLFETKEHFLKKGITLTTLAKKIKTNSNYLSEIINTYKEKNFNTYLNDLRIEYALNRLAKDKKFRSYKIPFIAEELGYNNEQAFTLAFKKRTGTPLSIYLKEIEKINTNSE